MKRNINENYMIEVDKTGFTLWDRNTNTWILDASSIKDNDKILISKSGSKLTETRKKHSSFRHFRTKYCVKK